MTKWMDQAFISVSPARGRKMSRAEQAEEDRKAKEYGERLLHYLERKVRRLRDTNMGTILCLEMIELHPGELSYKIKLTEELGERDDVLQMLFENLHQLIDHDVPLDRTVWELDCEWGGDFLY